MKPNLNPLKPYLSSVVCALLLTACASYPLGMSEAQWLALTPEQQYDAQLKQAELDRQREARRLAEQQAREQALKEQQAQLELARENAKYGERVQCVLQNSELYFNKKWRASEPLALDLLAKQPAQAVKQSTADGRYGFTLYAQFDGQTLSLCRHENSRRQECALMLGTFNDYHRGLRQAIQQDNWLRGQLRCQFVPKVW
ncbi:hypothetical protein JG661_07000 [Vibrio cholerae]|uniref:hypothetical protein n=1 Tax=Vibrio cholerae TaxID=666 RepID=UPI0018F08BFF|nr:hypothetical protein [Vibrio cholerae]MBJ6909051.1 hypothetical protein [Vibrio cholerae]